MAITTANFASLVSLVTRLADKELTTDELYSILDRVQAIANYNAPAAEPPKVDLVLLFNALCEGKKIEAIKMHRMLTGYGLKESKDEIERVMGKIPTYSQVEVVKRMVAAIQHMQTPDCSYDMLIGEVYQAFNIPRPGWLE